MCLGCAEAELEYLIPIPIGCVAGFLGELCVIEEVSLPLVESAELRSVVRAIAGRYGHDYLVRTAREGKSPTALWEDLGAPGLLGIALEGRRGMLGDLAVVTEELAAVCIPLMLPALSPAVCASILARAGIAEQKERWLPGLPKSY